MNSTLKKTLQVLFYGACFYLLNRFLLTEAAIAMIRFNYSHPFIVFISVIRGPWLGGFGYALGEFLTEIGKDSFDWIAIACSFLNCFSIGICMKSVDIHMGFFEKKDIIRFNNIQLIFNLACWSILYPVLSSFFMHIDLKIAFSQGIWKSIGFYISDLTATTLFLVLYARTRVSEANFYRN